MRAEIARWLLWARTGGGEKAVAIQRKRGKLLPRERIEIVLDKDTPFLELSPLAASGLYDDQVPSAGVVSGIGTIGGKRAMIVANDSTVKGGTYFPLTLRKHLRAQEIAEENRLPVLYLVDSGGAHLPLQSALFADRDHGGRTFFNQAVMSAAGIPQVSVCMGSATAGGAYTLAMSDELIMVEGTSHIFLGGPPLVKASTGEVVSAEDLGGADVHCRKSGVADYKAKNEEDSLMMARDVFEHMAVVTDAGLAAVPTRPPQPPHVSSSTLQRFDSIDVSRPLKEDPLTDVLAAVVDGPRMHEFKPLYGGALRTAFAWLDGIPVGILASNALLDVASALKGAHFVELCCQRRTPLIFFVHLPPDNAKGQFSDGTLTKAIGKMASCVATASVPKLTVVMGSAIGYQSYAMCTRPMGPRFLFLWPSAAVAVTTPENAVRDGYTEDDAAALAQQSTALYSTACVWDDGIILPEETRDVLRQALRASLNAPLVATRLPVLRM